MSAMQIAGERFGRLVVLNRDFSKESRKSYWLCLCDCGNEKIVRGDTLKEGKTQSCGCLHKESSKVNLTMNHSHKQSGTTLHNKWIAMKGRCYNKNNPKYYRYGERGIEVYEGWRTNFVEFRDWAIKNGYEEGLSLERKDVDGDYSPDNCEWIPFKDQANNRRLTKWVEYNGEKINLKQLSIKTGINYGTLSRRYNNGYRGEDLIKPLEFKPKKKRNGNSNLNECQVKEIKELLSQGETLTNIGKRYEVSKHCISDIKRGKTWKNVKIS